MASVAVRYDSGASSTQNDAPSYDCNPIFNQQPHGFGVNAMFLFQDAQSQRFHRIVVEHRDNRLGDDRTRVHTFIHKVHGAAGEFDTVICLLYTSDAADE